MIKQTLAATLLAISAGYSTAAYQPLDAIVAVVDNDVITRNELDKRLQQLKAQNPQMAEADSAEFKHQVLNRLIIENIQLQMARRAGIAISDERLTQAIANIAERNNLTLQQFREKMAAEGMPYTELREQIRRDITFQQLQQGHLRRKIQITEQEVDNFLNSAEGKQLTATRYNLSHILVPVASESQSNKALKTLKTIHQQLIQGKADFEQLLQGAKVNGFNVSGSNFGWQEAEQLPSLFAEKAVQLDKGSYSQPIRSGAGWHLLYLQDKRGGARIVHQQHARHILIKPSEVRTEEQAEALAKDLYKRIQDGEDFTLLAKEYSEDPGSALQGGDLGWSNPGQFVPAFETTLSKLGNNEISQPFKSRFGWHIMQKLGERDHDATQEEQRNQAYQTLYERKFAEERENWLLKIRDEAFVELKE